MKRKGIEPKMDEINKKEKNGEPLEWELQLIKNDHDTRKLIFDILTQKIDIEMYAKAAERPEEYLKDIKDLTSNPYNILHQHPESEREKERFRRKQANKNKLEKQFVDNVKKWERHEEDKERERIRNKTSEEDLYKRKKRLMERDLNYDSEEEKKRLKDPKRIEELKAMRMKENELDEQIRRQTNPHLYPQPGIQVNNQVTDLVAVESNEIQTEEQAEERVLITYKEYIEEDDDHNHHKIPLPQLNLNIEKKTLKNEPLASDYDTFNINDPYVKKGLQVFHIDEETEKQIMEISEEVKLSRQEEEKHKLQQQNIKNIVNKSNSNESSQKLVELQKEIFQQIPKDKDELFRYPVNWNYLVKVRFI
jgi:hypothetical protein